MFGVSKWGLLVGLVCGLSLGCAAELQRPKDASALEIMRIRVSKVRHAIEQTREALALSQGAAYAPELNLRLAELLSEEASYHYRVAQMRSQGETKALHVPQVRLLKEQSIALYEEILERFPDAKLRDQALFNMSYEYRELGDFDQMLGVLNRLVDELPNSELRNDALLILGDYHFDRNELEVAKGHYQRITDGPVHRVSPIAHYKLAWVWVNQGACKRALQDFEAAAMLARAQAEDDALGQSRAADEADGEVAGLVGHDGIDVRRSAVVDSVYCFSQERPAMEALPFLLKMADDRATYVAGLERMARRLAVLNHAQGTTAVVRELLRVGPPTEERLEDARQLHTALRASKRYEEVASDVELMTDAFHAYGGQLQVTAAELQKVEGEFEAYIRDLLTRGQEFVQHLPQSAQPEAAAKLALGYRAYLRSFPQAAARVDMWLNAADVYALAKDPFEAGNSALRAAEEVGEQTPRGQDALYNAVVHFQTALGPADGVRDGRRRVLALSGLRRSGHALLQRPLDTERERRVKFAVAETYYWGGQHRSAVDYLSAVAYEFPSTKEGDAAVRLLLDSLNLINDFSALVEAGRRFSAGNSPATAAVRGEIPPIIAAAEQRMIDEVSLEAAGEEGGDLDRMLAFADNHKGNRLGERALLNAFMAARAMGETDKLYTLGDQLVQNYPNSDQLPGIVSTLSQMALARSDFDRALKYFQSAAGTQHPQRVQLLIAAGQLQQDLGDPQGAQQTLRRAVAEANAAERDKALAQLAELDERLSDPRATIGDVQAHERQAGPETLARFGLALVEAGQQQAALTRLQRVLNGSGERSGAAARAHYGLAELRANVLAQEPPLSDPQRIAAYLEAVETVRQAFVNAVREGDPAVTPLALGRLAAVMEDAAGRLAQARLPAGLAPEEQAALQGAIQGRAEQLRAAGQEALQTCAEQAFALSTFGPAARSCLEGQGIARPGLQFDRQRPRRAARSSGDLEDLKQRVAKNPEDNEARVELAEAYLDAGDGHAARLLLADVAAQAGPEEINLLGLAHHAAGDTAAALSAFNQAAGARLEVARQNLSQLLRTQGLTQAAAAVLKRYPEGRGGGRKLQGGAR